ncbi:unnamed protein product [Caenorhabditis sp. 36 PRJEB53466]|nr:unnamed protein product [Caenorhabditis sp. 36 PRJEB53466]
MAAIIGGGPRRPPRIMARKNIVLKRLPRGARDDETAKLKRQGYEVQSGVLTVTSNHPSNFKPKQLPGIANDVESYPCRFCDEKVFLTTSGLEKHGREHHLQNIDDIITDIAMISGEWKKREFERLRSRERISMDKLRHEARAHQLVRAVLAGGNPDGSSLIGGEQYEACTICNMLVNIAHPTAMESHQRAHKKNDELRLQLIDQYGPEAVQRLTCEACSLVFPDQPKLKAHVASHHTRRKKYICKFCGHISQSMSELNLHKSDVHNYSAWNNVPEFLKARRSFFQYDERLQRMRRRTAEEMIQDVALNRPRLLFKHMERVHMKTSFSCMVETGGLPTFEIEVQNSEISWNCCESRFDNRAEFIHHRRLHIPTQQEEVVVENPEDLQMPTTTQAMVAIEDGGVNEDGVPTTHNIPAHFVQNPDGTVQVIIPEGIEIGGEVYLLFDDYEGGKTGNRIQLVPQDVIQQQDDEAGGSGEVHHMSHHYQIMQQEVDGEEEMMDALGEEEVVEDGGYEQYQMHDWGNMEMILVNGDEVLEEEPVEHHQMMEDEVVEEEDDEGVVQIDGQPLFD